MVSSGLITTATAVLSLKGNGDQTSRYFRLIQIVVKGQLIYFFSKYGHVSLEPAT